MEKIVVIGSNSFSGAHFVNYALDQGYSVVGMSRSEEPHPVFLPYRTNKNVANFQFLKLDLNHDLGSIMSVIDDVRPPYVVNFAAQSMVAESWQFPEHWFTTNAVSTVRFHDQLRKREFLKKYVHISTPEVYGSCSGLVSEDYPFNPSTPYAVSRAAADMSLKTFYNNYQFPVVFTRAANVFGPGQQLYRIIPRAALFIRLGKKLQLHGGGKSVRSFIHIGDVSDGTLRVMLDGKAPEAYHLSTTRQISIRALVELMCESLKVKFEDVVEVVGERPGKDAAYLLDSHKAISTLGWKDKISLEQGIEDTVKWIDTNLDAIKGLPFDYIHKP